MAIDIMAQSRLFPVGERILTLNYADKHNPVPQFGEVTGMLNDTNSRMVLVDGEKEPSAIPLNNLMKVFKFANGAK